MVQMNSDPVLGMCVKTSSEFKVYISKEIDKSDDYIKMVKNMFNKHCNECASMHAFATWRLDNGEEKIELMEIIVSYCNNTTILNQCFSEMRNLLAEFRAETNSDTIAIEVNKKFYFN